ncbi:hypothetical protein [Halorhodospira neutriphila]|uniref:hypothetical protein n=1 Tax=Halorhodospira neutriphila TaxID=168379 RepID=UPI001903FB5D|nr:hypothetical protein [Halorhodospira neutriphila]
MMKRTCVSVVALGMALGSSSAFAEGPPYPNDGNGPFNGIDKAGDVYGIPGLANNALDALVDQSSSDLGSFAGKDAVVQQDGSSNEATVNQEGASSKVGIYQSTGVDDKGGLDGASNNDAAVTTAGSQNVVGIVQMSNGDTATANVDGDNNIALQAQVGPEHPDENTAEIDIDGNDNTVIQGQGRSDGKAARNKAIVDLDEGDGNAEQSTIEQFQDGFDNKAYVGNTASDSGYNANAYNNAEVLQEQVGDNNKAVLYGTLRDTTVEMIQLGSSNTARINEANTAGGSSVTISQDGKGNRAALDKVGQNESTVTVSVDQIGDENTVEAATIENGADVTVTQDGTGHSFGKENDKVNVDGATVNVHQTGQNQTAYLESTGPNNTVDIAQAGSGNVADITQE